MMRLKGVVTAAFAVGLAAGAEAAWIKEEQLWRMDFSPESMKPFEKSLIQGNSYAPDEGVDGALHCLSTNNVGTRNFGMPLDVKKIAGPILVEARVKGVGVERGERHFAGPNLMIHYFDPTVKKARKRNAWRKLASEFGTFDWKTWSLVDVIPPNVSNLAMVVTLQGCRGELWVDDITIWRAREVPDDAVRPPASNPAADAIPRGLWAGRVRPDARRGVMSGRDLSEDAFRTLWDWGANLIRLQISVPPKGIETDEDYLLALSNRLNGTAVHLDRCRRYGLKACLDLHGGPRTEKTKHAANVVPEGYDTALLRRAWRMIATRFRGDPAVYGYDILNEPSCSAQTWRRVFEETVAEIRTVDATTPVITESLVTYYPPEMNVIYSPHFYTPHCLTHYGVGTQWKVRWSYLNYINGVWWDRDQLRVAMKDVIDFSLAHPDARVYIGEFSCISWVRNADAYLSDCIELFEEYGWDWTYHAFREWPPWDVEKEPDELYDTDPSHIRPAKGDTARKRALLKGLRRGRGTEASADEINVRDYGACGDGVTKDTAAIQRAIDAAAAAGGGTVTVPRGEYLIGTVLLKSNVRLNLCEGSVLKGSPNLGDYLEDERSLAKYYALVGAIAATNVAIVGRGVIDGQGHLFPREKRDAQGQLSLGEKEKRNLRIRTVVFYRSRDIVMEDVSIVRACRWTVFFRECENVTCRRLTLDCFAQPNSDGLDIEAKHVLIEDCDIHCDDDAICLKSHNPDFVVEDVEVRNCRLASTCNLIKLGTASYGGFRDVRIHHCEIVPPRASLRETDLQDSRGFRKIADRLNPDVLGGWRLVPCVPGADAGLTGISGIALQAVDGGFIEKVHIHDITMKGVLTPITIRLGRRHRHPSGRPGFIRDILIENIVGEASSRIANSITGVPGLRPRDITIRNVRLRQKGGGTLQDLEYPIPEVETAYPENTMYDFQALPAWGFYLRHADNVRFENVEFELDGADARGCYVKDDCTGISFVRRYPPKVIALTADGRYALDATATDYLRHGGRAYVVADTKPSRDVTDAVRKGGPLPTGDNAVDGTARLKVVAREHVVPGTMKITADLSDDGREAKVRVAYVSSIAGAVVRGFTVKNPRIGTDTDPQPYELEELGEQFTYEIRR